MPGGPGASPFPPPGSGPDEGQKGPDARLYGGVVAAGLGAAGLIVMGVSLGQLAEIQDDPGLTAYRAGLTHDQSACKLAAQGAVVGTPGAPPPGEIDSLCGRAKAFEITTYVTAAAGGVLLATGAVLIVTSETVWPRLVGRDNASGWRLTPLVGPEGGGAAVTVRF
jgi:hypothetical protein